MSTALVIPAEIDEPIRLHQLDPDSMTDYHDLVGGNFQLLHLFRPQATLYVNEEGKLLDLPVNLRATALLWVHNRSFRGHDMIVGDAFIVGPGDDDGDDLPVPDELVDLLLHTEHYQVESQARDAEDWRVSEGTYSAWYPAYYQAITLAGLLADAWEVRVTAAQ